MVTGLTEKSTFFPFAGHAGVQVENFFCRATIITPFEGAAATVLVVAGVQFVNRTLLQHSASLGVPMWTVYAAVPIGAAIEAWFMLFPDPVPDAERHEGGDVLL